MFGISFAELFIVVLVCFILVGPKKTAELAYRIGEWLGKLRHEIAVLKETKLTGLDINPPKDRHHKDES